jgi:YD repeat-containing protein
MSISLKRLRLRCILPLVAAFLAGWEPAAAQQVSYIYDESGRLVAVVDPAGESARYTYDAAGNLLAITRQPVSQLAIFEFTPNAGPSGTKVTIYGSGFSATPSQNVVRFNGVAATVSSSTSTQILTTVPSGATTGPITVATGSASVSSASAFTVQTGKPSVASFKPAIAVAGADVAISGKNFDPIASSNVVLFNGTRAVVGAATATTLTARVPSGTGSGKVTVSTAYGTAVSAKDFFIAPAPFAAGDVGATARLKVGGSATVSLSAPEKIALVVFDATAGQRVSVQLSSVQFSSGRLTIYSPQAAPLSTHWFSTTGGLFETPALPIAGTYSILIDPDANYTGGVGVTLFNASDVVKTITPGGSAVTVATTIPGQNVRVTFKGGAGDRISVLAMDVTISGTQISLVAPDGSILGTVYSGTTGTFLDTRTLPAAGTYTLLVDPSDVYTGSATLRAFKVPADPSAVLSATGAGSLLTLSTAGQNARLTFAGTAGRRYTVSISGNTIPDYSYLSLLAPDGEVISWTPAYQHYTTTIETPALATSGTYAVVVDPQGPAVGAFTAALADVSDVTLAATPGGAAIPVAVSAAGQNAALTFSASAGQRVSVTLTDSTFASAMLTLLAPDGSVVATGSAALGEGFMDAVRLESSGTHTLRIDPAGAYTGSASVRIHSVPADATVATTIGGARVVAATTVPGQNAVVTFSGTAGQQVNVHVSAVAVPGAVGVTLLGPDGTQIRSAYVLQSGAWLSDVLRLEATGGYSVVIDPALAGVGKVSVALLAAEDVLGTISAGTPVTLSTTVPGQRARVSFNASAGQRFSVKIADLTTPSAVVRMLDPSGNELGAVYVSGHGFLDTVAIAEAGTHWIELAPHERPASARLTLHAVPPDAAASIVPGGAPLTVNITAPGQRGRVTFTGSAGTSLRVSIGNVTLPDMTSVTLVDPSGTPLASAPVFQGGSGELTHDGLPESGTYAIVIDPETDRIGSLMLNDAAEAGSTLTVGGGPARVTLSTAGQTRTLTFSGTAGQRVSVNLTSIAVSSATVTLQQPDRTALTEVTVWQGGNSFIDAQTLPVTGTYRLVVSAAADAVGSVTVTLYSAAGTTGSITAGGSAVVVGAAAPGQNPEVTFTSTAGQRASVVVSNISIPGAMVLLNGPDGVTMASTYVDARGAAGFIDVQTLAAGTHRIVVDPVGPNSGSATLRLYNVPSDVVQAIMIDGAPVRTATTVPGQNIRLTVQGGAGQRLGVRFSGMAIAGYATATLLNSTGGALGQTSLPAGSDGWWESPVLPADDTYTLLIDPGVEAIGAVSTSVENATDVAGTIGTTAQASVTIGVAGQNAALTFDGTSGQRVSIAVTGVTFSSGSVALLDPAGTPLASAWLGGTGGFLDAQPLPATGRYTVLVDASGEQTGGASARLYLVPADATAVISFGGSADLTTSTPGQNGRATFSGSAGQRGTITVTRNTFPGYTGVMLIAPDGTLLLSSSVDQGSTALVELPALPVAGSYAILMDPSGPAIGTASLRLNTASSIAATITAGGGAVTLTTTVPGQQAVATFSGTEGQRISLKISDVTIAGTSVALVAPDGTVLASTWSGAGGGFLDTMVLPQSGTYAIHVDPSDRYTGSATLRLYTVPADVAGTAVIGGAALKITTTVPGQNGALTFAGTIGQRVSVILKGSTIPDTVYVSFVGPDGSLMSQWAAVAQGATTFVDAFTLSATGTYRMRLDPQGPFVGSVTATLYNAADVTSSTTIGGPGTTKTTTRPGQNIAVTFNGTAGQQVSVSLWGSTIPDSASVSLSQPDGSWLGSTSVYQGGSGFLEAVTLPVSGTYTVLIDPTWVNVGSITFTVNNAAAAGGTIAPDGTPRSVEITTAGQIARLTFPGTVGQRVSVTLTAVTISSGILYIAKPDGSVLASTFFSTAGAFLDAERLPSTGTYTVVVDPAGDSTGTTTASLYDVVDVSAPIAADGSTSPRATTVPGQNIRLTFSGSVGQEISVMLGDSTFAEGAVVRLLKPSGAVLAEMFVSVGSPTFIDALALAESGTYSLTVDPIGASTGTMNVTLYDVPGHATSSVVVNGSAASVAVTVPGQNAEVTFAGNSGQNVTLTGSGSTLPCVQLTLADPQGRTTALGTACGDFAVPASLGVTGTFTVLLDPQGPSVGSLAFSVTRP